MLSDGLKGVDVKLWMSEEVGAETTQGGENTARLLGPKGARAKERPKK